MKKLLLSSFVVVALAAGGGYAYKAAADSPNAAPSGAPNGAPNGPPALPGPPAPPGPPGPPGPWAGGWGAPGGGPGGAPSWRKWGDKHSAFSLFANVQNKNLSPADIKIIATGILLEHGNHDWTVTNISTQTDKSIDFSFATQHGDVIATFAVDPATGRMQRIG